tara:strand:+ start:539 stop:1027 length:489 start_codon:yes stop_codon:yes gene_type:complete
MFKAVFLDRDGVINEERKDYVKNLNEFIILKGISKAIKLLKEKNFLVIIVTNQSAINRNLLTVDELNKIHDHLQDILKKDNAVCDAIYYCPHKPDENCNCRKPKPGLLLRATQENNIDLKNSFLIGDSMTDIEAANAIGCKGILLKENESLLDIVENLPTNQ